MDITTPRIIQRKGVRVDSRWCHDDQTHGHRGELVRVSYDRANTSSIGVTFADGVFIVCDLIPNEIPQMPPRTQPAKVINP